ncbi:MAG: ABC transporter permease [Candidatus Geothermincolia bacterium]
MTFFVLMLKNLWRNKTRTLLTLVGIGLGITTIIALGFIADGIKKSSADLAHPGSSDFICSQAKVSDLMLSNIDERDISKVQRFPGVLRAEGFGISVQKALGNPYFIVFGAGEASARFNGVNLVDGRFYRPGANEIVLGNTTAKNKGLDVGSSLSLFGREFKIVGIYKTGSTMQDSGCFADLSLVQQLDDRVGKVSAIAVKVKPGVDPTSVAKSLESRYSKTFATIATANDMSKVDQGVTITQGASWAVSLLAIIIGGIGVMNTMIITVYERTREIGVLKALGWRNWKIIEMVLGEAVLISLAAVLLGSIVGIALVKLLYLAPVMRSMVTPAYSLGLWVRATIIAVTVALLGGFYPAFRAARFSPVEALRYE